MAKRNWSSRPLLKAKPFSQNEPAMEDPTLATDDVDTTATPRAVPITPRVVPTTVRAVPTPDAVPTTPRAVPTPDAVPTTPRAVPTPGAVPTPPGAVPTPDAVPIPVAPIGPSTGQAARPLPLSSNAAPHLQQAGVVAVDGEPEEGDEQEQALREGPFAALLGVVARQPSWLISAFVHAALLLVSALIMVPLPFRDVMIVATMSDAEKEEETLEEFIEEQKTFEVAVEASDSALATIEEPLSTEALASTLEVIDNIDAGADAASQELADTGFDLAPANDLLSEYGRGTGKGEGSGTGRGTGGPGTGLGGRGARRGGATKRGATKESEEAVDRALKWLAAHQCRDGSWRMDHQNGICQGRCSNPGSAIQARYAATALGLLPFLGAGQSHSAGKYKNNVAAALNYLIHTQAADGNFHEPEGRMYAHGLVTLALCEALAMHLDGGVSPGEMGDEPEVKAVVKVNPAGLANAAQKAIYFIEKAQHRAGGWRYQPKEPGDTSVVGWQIMALKSGHMARLRVDARTILLAHRFLDSVACDEYGSTYGYTDREVKPSTSAIGLLCRMYGGWKRDHQGISGGAEYLSRQGPSTGDLYYSYYATQVMHHYGGPLWKTWNRNMRDSLVRTQSRQGHEDGSWSLGSRWAEKGGRLYETSLATLILEVYYRHMRIYQTRAMEEDIKQEAPQEAPKKIEEPIKKKDEFPL